MVLLPIFEMPSSPFKYERPRWILETCKEAEQILDEMMDDPFHHLWCDLPESLVLRKRTPMGQVAVKKDTFSVQVNATDFKPDEIAVSVKDRQLIVQAKHEENDSGSFVHREFRREFTIPPDVDPETIEAQINDDGLLSVRAKASDVRQVELKHNIQMEGSVSSSDEKKDTEDENHKTEDNTIVSQQKDDVGGFVMPVKTDGFKPNEISVKIKDQQVIIEATQEQKYSKSENDTVYSHTSNRELRREFTLPPGVDPETIVAEMNKDGLLKIKSSPTQQSIALDEDKQLDKPQEWIKLDVTRTESSDTSSMDNH